VAVPAVLTFAAVLWNLGLLVGIGFILSGNNTGYPWLELPRSILALFVILSAVFAFSGLLTLATRQERELYPAAWFIAAALLSLPWVLGTAVWTLLYQGVHGAVQLAVNGWFIHSLTWLWFGFLAIGTLFYVVARVSQVPLYSRYSAQFAFWTFAVLAGWGGVNSGAPLPRWITSFSEAANLLLLVPIALVVHNLWKTIASEAVAKDEAPALKLARFAIPALAAFGLLGIAFYLRERNLVLHLTLFQVGLTQMFLLGFVAFALFSGLYLMMPSLIGRPLCPNRSSLHCNILLGGLALTTLPFLLGGLKEASLWADTGKAPVDVTKALTGFIGVSTFGQLALLASAVPLLLNLFGSIKAACAGCCTESGPAKDRK
jgi:cytochrome c oxidase cbb3-type subunit 1